MSASHASLGARTLFRIALTTVVTLGFSAQAVAQETAETVPVAAAKKKDDRTELDAVEITGSRIKAVDMETSNPVFSIDRSQIKATGATTIGQLLQSLPAASGVVTNPQVNNGGGNGGASVNLRGLGGERTLVLLDGKRIIGTTFSDISYVDLNTLPINMIERVEILKEGASAVYGSDAIGGVVNIISRKNYEGGEIEATYGVTQENDGAHRNVNATWGAGSGNGHAVFGINYEQQDQINASDRPLTSTPTAYYFGHLSPNVGTSGRSPYGVYDTGDANCPGGMMRNAGATGTSTTDYHCFINNRDVGPTDRYNFLPDNLLLTPAKRFELFGIGEHALTDDIQVYGNAFFTHVESNATLAAEPIDNGTVEAVIGPTPISASNVYNPFGKDITTYSLRANLAGRRVETVETSTYQGTLGFKGTLFDSFQWDAAYTFGRIDQAENDYGFLNFSNLKNQLGPSFMDGDVARCGTAANPIPQCTPINLFGTTGATVADLATVANTMTKQDQQQAVASITGDLFQLPAGPLGAAAGLEYRQYSFDRKPDGLEQAFLLSENNSRPTKGSYNVREVFGELRIPVLADLPFVESLTLTPGVRFSDYSSFGTTTNAKYGIEYRPYSDLLVRATYADIFRAPTVNDLFKGDLQDAPGYGDPCNGYGGTDNPTSTNGDLACQNVPRDGTFEQTNTQASAVRKGNTNLKPETGYTTDYGFVFSPSFYRPLTIEVDYFKYYIEDTIGLLDTQSAINACFNDGQFCQYAGRSTDGQLSLAIEPTINNGSMLTEGVDFGFKLSYPDVSLFDFDLGSFKLSVDSSYLIKYQTDTIVAGQVLNSESLAGQTDGGGTGTFPRLKSFMTVQWNRGPVSVSVRDRFIGAVNEGSIYYGSGATAALNSFTDFGDALTGGCEGVTSDTTTLSDGRTLQCHRRVTAANYIDLSATYLYEPAGTSLTLGCTDLFNQGGKFISAAAATGLGTGYPTDPSTYDITGRAFFATLKVDFK